MSDLNSLFIVVLRKDWESQAAEIEELKSRLAKADELHHKMYSDIMDRDWPLQKECNKLRAELEACRRDIEDYKLKVRALCETLHDSGKGEIKLHADLQSSRDQVGALSRLARSYYLALEDLNKNYELPKAAENLVQEVLSSPDGRPSEMQEAVEGMALKLSDLIDAAKMAEPVVITFESPSKSWTISDVLCLAREHGVEALAAYRKAKESDQ